MMTLFKVIPWTYQSLFLLFLVSLFGAWGFLVRRLVPNILFGWALKQ